MAELAIPMLIASTALSAASSIAAGNEKSSAAALEQQQLLGQQQALDREAANTKIAADQTEARRRNELVSNLETIQSLRAGRGVGSASPTGMAILNNFTNVSEGDISAERFSYLSKADQYRMGAINAGTAAEQAGRRSQTSLLAGYLGAGQAVASGIFKGSGASKGYYSSSTG
jgi:hypothetical protein